MEIVQIANLRECRDVKELYQASFPKEEQVEFEKLFSGVFEGYEMFCIYDNNIIIALVHFKELENFVHVNYLAVKEEYQNKGYGSEFLSFIKKRYNQKALVLDIEEIDENAQNYKNRIRRVNFYKKNGFKTGKYKFEWEGVLMTYMNTEKIDAEEFMKYIQFVFPTIKNVRTK